MLGEDDWVGAIQALDRSRQMAPRNWELIEREITALESFIKDRLRKGVKRDAELLRGTITILQNIYNSGKYWRRAADRLGRIAAIIGTIELTLADGPESSISWTVEKILFNQFEDLTQEQRDELKSEILAEELIDMLIERRFIFKKYSSHEPKEWVCYRLSDTQ